jgi:hypothetical protein
MFAQLAAVEDVVTAAVTEPARWGSPPAFSPDEHASAVETIVADTATSNVCLFIGATIAKSI